VKTQVSVSPGAALVRRLRAEMASEGLEPDGREIELLGLARDLADRIGELESVINSDGLTSTSKGGLVRLHPADAHRVGSGAGQYSDAG
jgi:hypothetical protein